MPGVLEQVKSVAPYEAARALKNGTARLVFERGLIDTSEIAELKQFGLEAPERVRYESSGWTYLRRALRRLEVEPTDVFVDFGSGKGRVVWQAAHHSFARVVGIEISPELNQVARRNIHGNLDRLSCRDIELITADAAELNVPDDMTFAYFFSPFTGETFRRVMRQIGESLDRRPRRVTLIYANPVMHEAVLETGRFELTHVLKGLRPDVGRSGWVHLYSSSNPSRPRR